MAAYASCRGRWGRPRATGSAALPGRVSTNIRPNPGLLTVHKDVDEHDLHSVERVPQRDGGERRGGGAKLEGQEVLVIVKNRLACNTVSEVSTMGPKTDTTYPLRRPIRWC